MGGLVENANIEKGGNVIVRYFNIAGNVKAIELQTDN